MQMPVQERTTPDVRQPEGRTDTESRVRFVEPDCRRRDTRQSVKRARSVKAAQVTDLRGWIEGKVEGAFFHDVRPEGGVELQPARGGQRKVT